jgi:hypothetical protein
VRTRRRRSHSFVVFGAQTYLVDATGKTTWTYPENTRDGWLLPDKKIVWTYTNDRPVGIHHFQILETDGQPLKGQPLR